MRLPLAGGHFGLPSYRYLDVAIHDAPMSDLGVRCARPDMLALSNLLRNPEIGPDTMDALVEGRRIKRSNKDLGRVVAIARLSDPDAPRDWPRTWSEALRACHAEAWRALAGRAGNGLRALLRSEADLEEACLTCNLGLLADHPVTPEQLRRVAERVILDAVEPLEGMAHGGSGVT